MSITVEHEPVIREGALHHRIVRCGKLQGKRLVRVHIDELRLMAAGDTVDAPYAKAELARRGTPSGAGLVITHHSVDRASIHCLPIWKATRLSANEGLYAWLHRMARLALEPDNGYLKAADEIVYGGIVFAFNVEGSVPVLTTIKSFGSKRAALKAAKQDMAERLAVEQAAEQERNAA